MARERRILEYKELAHQAENVFLSVHWHIFLCTRSSLRSRSWLRKIRCGVLGWLWAFWLPLPHPFPISSPKGTYPTLQNRHEINCRAERSWPWRRTYQIQCWFDRATWWCSIDRTCRRDHWSWQHLAQEGRQGRNHLACQHLAQESRRNRDDRAWQYLAEENCRSLHRWAWKQVALA